MKSGFLLAFLGAGIAIYSEFLAAGFGQDYISMLIFASMLVPFIAASLCFDPMDRQIATFREMLLPAIPLTGLLALCMPLIQLLMRVQPEWSHTAATLTVEYCVLAGRVLGTLMFVIGLSIFLSFEDWRDLKPIFA